MTYQESSELINDPVFRGRVKIACLGYANYVMNENPATPAHNTLFRWAQQCFLNPDQVAAQVMQPTVMDAQVQTDGAAITDAALQSSVETTIKKMV